MGMSVIDAFVVTYGLDTSGFKKGQREVDDASKRLRENSKRTFAGMEDESRRLGESLKRVRNDVVGLGLAFLGASSITGLIKNMALGAASADRMGAALGMNVRQIWAWRMAVKSVGGQSAEADAAFQTIQNDRMDYRLGRIDATRAAIYSRLGVTADDLKNGNADSILRKISSMQGRMDPQLYGSLIQQLGLPNSIFYFFQQGKGSVDKLLAQFEKDAKGQEALAKETEDLQKSITQLQTTILQRLVPPLAKIADLLNRVVPGGSDGALDAAPAGRATEPVPGFWGSLGLRRPKAGGSAGDGLANDPVSLARQAWASATGSTSTSGPRTGKLTRAERNNNPGNIEDGAFARRQPGYIGGDGRFAKFASPAHGLAAMETLLMSYMRKGRNTIASIVSKWAPSSENNVGAYVASVERATGLKAHQQLSQAQIRTVAAAMAKHEGYRGNLTVGTVTINTKATDAKGIARDFKGALNRAHAVASADRGINP